MPEKLVVDFAHGDIGYRFRSGAIRSEALSRAVGFKRGRAPTVIDATAGLGRDAFLLASLGARVTLVERSPVVHALLKDGLERICAAEPRMAAVASRMTLLFGDARTLLRDLQADVIVVDPMHPNRRKTALVKEEMRLLRQLVGPDLDALELMQVALACAGERVILKWPLYANDMQGLRKPSYQVVGKTTRYDVFIIDRRTGRSEIA